MIKKLITSISSLFVCTSLYAATIDLENDYSVGDLRTNTAVNSDNTTLETTINNFKLADVNDVTATKTEVNYLAGMTLGTAVASKVLGVDANKDLTLGTGDFTCTDSTVTGNIIHGSSTLSSTETGYLDTTTPGTAVASKALVVDASKDLTLDGGDLTVQNLTVNGTLTGASDSYQVKVSSNDTTAAFLDTKVLAGEGLDVTEGSDGGDETYTFSGEDATTSNKGIASFNTNHFSVTTGAVSIGTDTIDDTLIDWGSGANQVNADDIPEGSTNLFQKTRVGIRAFAATDQLNFSGGGSEETIAFATEEYDTGSDFATPTFTVPTTGYYLIHVQAVIENLEGTETILIGIKKNSTTTYSYTNAVAQLAGTTAYLNASCMLSLTAADTIHVWASNDDGTPSADLNSGTSQTFIEILEVDIV